MSLLQNISITQARLGFLRVSFIQLANKPAKSVSARSISPYFALSMVALYSHKPSSLSAPNFAYCPQVPRWLSSSVATLLNLLFSVPLRSRAASVRPSVRSSLL